MEPAALFCPVLSPGKLPGNIIEPELQEPLDSLKQHSGLDEAQLPSHLVINEAHRSAATGMALFCATNQ